MWIDWYLDCMLISLESADIMLSSILNKAIFWQNHSQSIINDRQKNILNKYLDGYIGKLTIKRWSKLTKVSPDTAARDVKYLVDIGILVPQEGKCRNVAYGIVIMNDHILHTGSAEEDD